MRKRIERNPQMSKGQWFYAKRPEDGAIITITATQEQFQTYYVAKLGYIPCTASGEVLITDSENQNAASKGSNGTKKATS